MINKVKSIKEISKIVEEYRNLNKKICFTNGCFDILHSGHIKYLYAASKMADILIIGLNSDISVKKLKGNNRPINNEKDRALLLSVICFIDYIVIFNEDTPYNIIKHIKPDLLVKGGNWREKEIVGADIVRSYGGEVKSLSFHGDYSTSGIIRKMRNL